MDDWKRITGLLRTAYSWELAWVRYWFWIACTRPERGKDRVDAGDIRVFLHRYGSGTPVLLLHGGFMFWGSWVGQIPALAADYQVIALDSRGQGRTTLGNCPLTYVQMAEDVASLMERLELGPVHLIGSSDGGCTSLALALERPELVRSIVLIGTPFNIDNYSDASRNLIQELLRPGSPSLFGLKAFRRFMTPEPGRWPEFIDGMRDMWTELPDFTIEELGRIETPTLVISCDRDEFLSRGEDPLGVFKETAAAIPNARMVVIPGGTHSVQVEKPKALNQAILAFLKEV